MVSPLAALRQVRAQAFSLSDQNVGLPDGAWQMVLAALEGVDPDFEKLIADIEAHGSLWHYAAGAALKVIVENWKAALADGTELGRLLNDIDETSTWLFTFRTEMTKHIAGAAHG